MAIPNSDYTEVLTTTIANYRNEMADNILNHNPLLAYFKMNGNADPADGGAELLENLSYAENSTFGWYSGYEQLDTGASDTMTSANFAWKQANVNVAMSGLEKMKNAGKSRMHSLIKNRIKNAEKTMQNKISEALYYSNTESSGKAIGGLQHLVADNPGSGTVGGIAESGNTWWHNEVYDFSAEGVTASPATIQTALNLVYLRCIRGTDHPKLIVAGETFYNYFHESLQPQQRFTAATKAVGGFDALEYRQAKVCYDPNCASNRMYVLNPYYLFFRPHGDRNFVTEDDKISVNQDAIVVPMYWGGNMTVSNRALQGVIVA